MPPPWKRIRVATCDGCGAEGEVAPFSQVELCLPCFVFAVWLDEDARAEAAEYVEGLTP